MLPPHHYQDVLHIVGTKCFQKREKETGRKEERREGGREAGKQAGNPSKGIPKISVFFFHFSMNHQPFLHLWKHHAVALSYGVVIIDLTIIVILNFQIVCK